MCGIVGFIGKSNAREVVLKGLTALEYRGYDSAGIAMKHGNDVEIFKDKGRVNHLKEISKIDYEPTLAIGHTRWATHGEPNQSNSHPHVSNSGRFIIVHNGVIE
ncbi:MAG: glutamine--fructose-6-phosphate aminotransferase, partial [Bacilli bacterium]|nr:glutamine--fructose-6-phosphate aminotransferase [Bacilli bacterium]